MKVVTSFSKEGYQLYGRVCLESFVKHWPCEIVVFYETQPNFSHEKIEYRDLFDIEGIRPFLEHLNSVDGADGVLDGHYDYRFDASRFCRKVFAVDSVFDEDDIVFWLDADTVTFKEIPEDFLKDLVKNDPFCYLGRSNFCSETGFVGFNTKHPDFYPFRERYLPTYTSGGFMSLRTWEDAVVFDHARSGLKGNDLNHTMLQGVDHVWPHTVLGKYMEHMKGGRKLLPKRLSGQFQLP